MYLKDIEDIATSIGFSMATNISVACPQALC